MAGLPLIWNSDDSRGVSDLVAFVLTFSIIITSVAAVSVGGLGSLEQFSEQTRADSAEVAMTGFDDSLEDIRVDGVPQRTHELSLNGDQLWRFSSQLEITIEGTPTGDQTETVDVGAFVRQTGDDTDIVYEGGTVYRDENRGEVVVREPAFRCGSDVAHVSLVSVSGDVNVSSNSVTLRARENGSTSVYPDLKAGENGSASAVEVSVDATHNQAAWERLFEEELDGWSGSSGTYTCDDVGRVYLHNTSVELDAIR